nr:reverse transcriptase domain-containing protein [Tanacetum cinerariifolium]
DPESLIRRRNLGEPSSLFDFEETMSIPHNNQGPPPAGPHPQYNNGPPSVVTPNGPAPDLRSMEELCQPSINGQGGPIAPILIQSTNFRLRHRMIQHVQNSCQFYGLPGDDSKRHIDKFLEVTQHMKQNRVFDDALRLSLFLYSLTHHATACAHPSVAIFKSPLMLLPVTTIRGVIPANHKRQSPSGSGSLPSNTIANLRGNVKAINTQSGVAYEGPTILPTSSSFPKEVEREPEVTRDKVTDIQKKDENKAKTDKTKHEMEKREKSKSTKVKVQDGVETKEILNGPTHTYLMARCMHTRSSSDLVGESSPNPTTSNPKRCNHRHSKQPFILEESPIDTMADQRTMDELLRAPTEGYAEEIMVPPILAEHFELKHSLINMMTSDQFFELVKDNPHDHIRWFNKITFTIKYKDVPNSAIKLMLFLFSLAGAARRWLKKEPPRSILTWEDLVSKFINEFFPPSKTTNLPMTVILKRFQATPPPASVKALEEIFVTYGSAHPYYQCLAADGNTFLEFQDNIQGYVSAVAVNYNQGNSGYRPSGVANQIQPLGFAQPNVQNNQNRFSQPQGYNRGNNFNQDSSYQAPIQQNQIVPLTITTRSGLVLDGPFVPMPPPFINPKEDERVDETLTDQDLGEYTIKVPPPFVQKDKPHSQRNYVVHQRDHLHPNIPYPSWMHKQKRQDKDEIQIHKFWQMFKQLHINITFADALILILKYQKMLIALLSNKEKILELANTPLNENCLAVILKKLPEKLRHPGKFLILCGFSELKCKALAN